MNRRLTIINFFVFETFIFQPLIGCWTHEIWLGGQLWDISCCVTFHCALIEGGLLGVGCCHIVFLRIPSQVILLSQGNNYYDTVQVFTPYAVQRNTFLIKDNLYRQKKTLNFDFNYWLPLGFPPFLSSFFIRILADMTADTTCVPCSTNQLFGLTKCHCKPGYRTPGRIYCGGHSDWLQTAKPTYF